MSDETKDNEIRSLRNLLVTKRLTIIHLLQKNDKLVSECEQAIVMIRHLEKFIKSRGLDAHVNL